jgi:hypothetical protein
MPLTGHPRRRDVRVLLTQVLLSAAAGVIDSHFKRGGAIVGFSQDTSNSSGSSVDLPAAGAPRSSGAFTCPGYRHCGIYVSEQVDTHRKAVACTFVWL